MTELTDRECIVAMFALRMLQDAVLLKSEFVLALWPAWLGAYDRKPSQLFPPDDEINALVEKLNISAAEKQPKKATIPVDKWGMPYCPACGGELRGKALEEYGDLVLDAHKQELCYSTLGASDMMGYLVRVSCGCGFELNLQEGDSYELVRRPE